MKLALLLGLVSVVLVACFRGPSPPSPESTSTSLQQTAEFYSLAIQESPDNWWNNTIFYEIWPRSFYDSDGDGSGDFNGMTAKLDYLSDLEVDGIWLTPVFEAPSYHGYDFEDFFSVESDYGTMEEFENFIAESHKRGIKVILDLVLNHISSDHEWFKKSAKEEAGFEDYFIWKKERPSGWGRAWGDEPDPKTVWHWNETRQEYYYAVFSPAQPDVNLRSPKVVDELNRLAKFWLQKGVDGFRLDAVRYAIEEGGLPLQADTASTIDYWAQFSRFVKSINPDVMLVGEAWTGLPTVGKYHNQGDGLDAAFDFDFGYVVAGLLNPEVTASADFGTVSSKNLQHGREDLWENLKGRKASAPLSFFSPFLTNHDQNRIAYTLGGDLNKAKIAASLLFTTPGPLYMYYGEEIGMTQFKTGDDQFRRAIMQWNESENAGFNETGNIWLDQPKWFPWMKNYQGWWGDYWKSLIAKGASVEAQRADENSLYHHYRRLISVRKAETALQFPEEIRYYPVDNKEVWLVENIRGEESAWVLVNLNPASDAVFASPKALQGQRTDKLTGRAKRLEGSVRLEPAEVMIF